MEEFNKKLVSLLSQAGITNNIVKVEKISDGGNNRTFKVYMTGQCYIFKQYFRHKSDVRDRLRSEYSFLNYASIVASKWTPKPICKCDDHGCALYEFIDGSSYDAESISEKEVADAAQFFIDLNDPEKKNMANNMPNASEACFSIIDHINLVKGRLRRLREIKAVSIEDHQAIDLCRELEIIADTIIINILVDAKKFNIDIYEDLTYSQRCVSPSDFGFHNAIKTKESLPRFIDFEYAGWDDPAKMVGDFFAQLAVPIPNNYFEKFTIKCMDVFVDPQTLINRSSLLAPLYKIKWCCIALNVFLPVNLTRRKFANSDLCERNFKSNQLLKARKLLGVLGEL